MMIAADYNQFLSMPLPLEPQGRATAAVEWPVLSPKASLAQWKQIPKS